MAPSKVKQEEVFEPQVQHPLKEFTAPAAPEPFYQKYEYGVPIALDLGSSQFRIGLTNSDKPNNVFASVMARYRDRKANYSLTLVGNDVYRDPSTRSSIKSPFDGSFITNWEYMEAMLDYSFEHLGVTSNNGSVNNPIIMTEPVACISAQRKSMYELLFDVYQVPKVAYGIDSLFSFYANNGGRMSDGLVIGTGHEATHVIPVLNGRGILAETKRIDFGGNTAANFLAKLLSLKYPYFPTRLSPANMTNLFRDHCYIAEDYQEEIQHILDMDLLENTDVVIQAPVDISATVEKKKTDEELAKQAERRREQGKRLQEQARQRRLEKLVQKEEEFTYFTNFKSELDLMTAEEAQERLEAESFDDMSDLIKYLTNLEKSIKKAHSSSNGDEEEEENEHDPTTAWPLVDIPDDHLTPEELKEKRKQRLHKANFEAREKNREAKRKEEEMKVQYEKEQEEWRKSDLEGWCSEKRIELAALIKKIKDRQKLIDSFKDRKSAAAQQRMKNIADLANDENGSTNAASRKRRRNATSTIDNDPTDTFGANDDDWNLYRDISNVNLEEEQAEDNKAILKLEEELLEFDPNFHHEDTLAASQTFDWRNAALHKFLHGPRPNISLAMQIEGLEPDEIANKPEIILKNHQIHLNVERIRVPEILFQPTTAGLDQAGIGELADDLLRKRLDNNFNPGGQAYSLAQNVFLTGGLVNLRNLKSRIVKEFTSFIPVGTPLNVKTASDPTIDPWRGMQMWSSTEECSNSYVTRAEYEEMGPDYIKEHGLGNVCLS